MVVIRAARVHGALADGEARILDEEADALVSRHRGEHAVGFSFVRDERAGREADLERPRRRRPPLATHVVGVAAFDDGADDVGIGLP